MRSAATTVAEYLASLPADRCRALESVRDVVLQNLDSEFEEGMQYGMIGYYVPHRVYPAGYHCDPRQPLPFAALASQKNHLSIYLMSVYGEGPHWDWFHKAWAKTGKKLDMGKCCIRFQRVEDLPLDVIGQAIARTTARQHIARYEEVLSGMRSRRKSRPQPAAKSTSQKTHAKKMVAKAKPAAGKRPQAATHAAGKKTVKKKKSPAR